MSLFPLAGLTGLSFAIAWAASAWLVGALGRHGMLDHPNDRSSHVKPTPRGGGLAILAAILPAWAMIFWLGDHDEAAKSGAVLAGLAILGFISWRDDRGHLPWGWRLAVQGLAVGLVLAALVPAATRLNLPLYFLLPALLVATLAWLWVINLFNFMDGIDGIVGSEMIFFATATALLLAFGGAGGTPTSQALTLSAAVLGFLCFNWPPARIFLGDVGSIPLGFLAGYFMMELAMSGLWGAALSLPAIFLADASLTLAKRFLKGARLTEAHREHFYQLAAGLERGRHRAVVLRIVAANAALLAACVLGLALPGWRGQVLTLVLAVPITLVLLFSLYRASKQPT